MALVNSLLHESRHEYQIKTTNDKFDEQNKEYFEVMKKELEFRKKVYHPKFSLMELDARLYSFKNVMKLYKEEKIPHTEQSLILLYGTLGSILTSLNLCDISYTPDVLSFDCSNYLKYLRRVFYKTPFEKLDNQEYFNKLKDTLNSHLQDFYENEYKDFMTIVINDYYKIKDISGTQAQKMNMAFYQKLFRNINTKVYDALNGELFDYFNTKTDLYAYKPKELQEYITKKYGSYTRENINKFVANSKERENFKKYLEKKYDREISY